MAIPFKSRNNRPATVATEPGNPLHKKYVVQLDPNGHKVLVENGFTDTYAKTQVDLEACKVENIIRRYEMGDLTALQVGKVAYIDATEMPTDFAQMQNAILKAKHAFDEFPLEIKQIYNGSAEQFIADIGSEHYKKLFGSNEETAIKEPVIKEVATDGQKQ